MLIAMTGFKRSGKDTVANDFHDIYNAKKIAFAGPLKDMIRKLLEHAGMSEDEIEEHIEGSQKEVPLDVLQGKTSRYAMQTLGTEWRNFLGKDLWTDIVKAGVQKHLEEYGAVVLTDMRFLHEEQFVRDLGGVRVRVVRYGQRAPADPHPSEVEQMEITADYTIYNHGNLRDLSTIVNYLADELFDGIPLGMTDDE